MSDLLSVYFQHTVQLTYDRTCVQEPIGRELFRQFCSGSERLQRAIDFLDEVVRNEKAHLAIILYAMCEHSSVICGH